MTKTTNAVGFCLLKLLITARFSPAHTEPRKMADTTAMAVNIPRGFRNLQGMAASLNRAQAQTGQMAQPSGHMLLLQ